MNPVASNSEGAFGWEVVPGFYEVTASTPGCGNSTSPLLEVPPEPVGLELVLHCENLLQIETTTLPAAQGSSVETIKTLQRAWWETLLGTLPSTRLAPCMPRLPTTMRPAPTSDATCSSASAASV